MTNVLTYRIYRMNGKYHELIGCVHAHSEEHAKQKAVDKQWSTLIVAVEIPESEMIVKV